MIGRYCLAIDDLIDRLAPTITASAEDPAYPVTNWSIVEPAKPSKLTDTSGWWEFDFGVAVNAAVFSGLYHNFDPGLPVVLKWNSSSSWVSPAGSHSFTVPEWTEDEWSVNFWDEIPGTPTQQFWRLEVGLAGSPGNSQNLVLGRPFFGGALRDLENDVRWGVVEEGDYPLIDQQTEGHVEQLTEIWGPRRLFSGELALYDTTADTLISHYRAAKHRLKPWLLIPDVAVNDAWIVRFMDTKYSRTRETINHNIFPFRVQELSRGIPWP